MYVLLAVVISIEFDKSLADVIIVGGELLLVVAATAWISSLKQWCETTAAVSMNVNRLLCHEPSLVHVGLELLVKCVAECHLDLHNNVPISQWFRRTCLNLIF